MSQRFSYVRYDEKSAALQEAFKKAFENVEAIGNALGDGRAKALFLTHLEIAYMWTGKAIRDEQIGRDSLAEHVAERTNE